MCREQMLSEIYRMVQEADDPTLESCYWFLIMEMGS